MSLHEGYRGEAGRLILFMFGQGGMPSWVEATGSGKEKRVWGATTCGQYQEQNIDRGGRT